MHKLGSGLIPSIAPNIYRISKLPEPLRIFAQSAQLPGGISSLAPIAVPRFDHPLLKWASTFKPSPLLESIGNTLRSLEAPFAALVAANKRQLAAKRAGWLLDETIPDHLIDETATADDLDMSLGAYFAENWLQISSAMRETVASYEVDCESIECFSEALANHADGRYRSVSRLLFPEIERVAGTRFYPGPSRPAGLERLRYFAGVCPASEMDWSLFAYLYRQMYESAYGPDRLRFESIHFPNRHMILHGHLPYNDYRHSINSIFVTKFVYRLIALSKRAEFQEEFDATMAASWPELRTVNERLGGN